VGIVFAAGRVETTYETVAWVGCRMRSFWGGDELSRWRTDIMAGIASLWDGCAKVRRCDLGCGINAVAEGTLSEKVPACRYTYSCLASPQPSHRHHTVRTHALPLADLFLRWKSRCLYINLCALLHSVIDNAFTLPRHGASKATVTIACPQRKRLPRTLSLTKAKPATT